jgi:hypothetical protein
MYANDGIKVTEAIKLAKEKRDKINPIGSFPELLDNLRKALDQKGLI